MGSRWQHSEVVSARTAGERGNRYRAGGAPVVLLYPSPYRAGMSSLGYQWVLRQLQDAGVAAERAFRPDGEDWQGPIRSYETGLHLGEFPVIGVSLAYELELADLVRCLLRSGIPALRSERGPEHPRVLLGGPLTFSNPLPAAPFVDAMLVGEADHTVVEALAFEGSRQAWLDRIAGLDGGFVPERHGTRLPATARAPDHVLPARSHLLSPDAELADMFLVEGERGCHRACTFCVMRRQDGAGMRLVGPEALLDLVPPEAPRVGLVGAAISDHPRLVELLGALVDRGLGVGISSLRADRVRRKPDIARLLRAGGYKTLTVASDAASERLRRSISKGTREDDLLACAELAREHGYRQLKVYMMLGVPDETDEDIEELVEFTCQLSSIHPVSLGVAPFVPKRNSPLDGAGFAGVKVVEGRLKSLTRGLRGRAEVRPTSARWAWVEAELAQGGPEAGLAVAQAVSAGGRFLDFKQALGAVDPAARAPWRRG